MVDRGKLVVSSIVVVALSLAAFGWWWNYEQGRRSMEFWGREQARLIRQAPKVELLRLRPAEGGDGGERIYFAGKPWHIVAQTEISGVQGLLHARFALTVDASFEFEVPAEADSAAWTVAARFTQEDQAATVLFDFIGKRVGIAEQGRAARVVPKIVSGWQEFAGRHLPAADEG